MNLQTQIEMMRDPTRFTRLFGLLIGAEYPDYQVIDDTRADAGNDGYLPSEKRMFARHCFAKPEKQKNDEAILKKLKGDFAKAVKRKKAGDYDIENWTFVTNYLLPDHIAKAMRDLGETEGIKTTHKGAGYIAELAIKHKELLDEFPELRQATLAEEMHARFDGLEAKMAPDPKVQLVTDLTYILRQLLVLFKLYGKREVNPYLNHVNNVMVQACEKIEDKLIIAERLLGDRSSFYKSLETLTKELHAGATVELMIDGGHSWRQRQEHIEKAQSLTYDLLQEFGAQGMVENLENAKIDVQRKIVRWLEGIDETYRDFFNKAEDKAIMLLEVYALLHQIDDKAAANRWSQLAEDIVALASDDRSGFGPILDKEIPAIRQRARMLDLSAEETELLEIAVKHSGNLNVIRVDQTPPGHFVRAGNKSYASETDASVARSYIEALDSLQENRLVEPVSGNLFTVTSAGWQKVGGHNNE